MSPLSVPNFSPIRARIRVLWRILRSVQNEDEEELGRVRRKLFAMNRVRPASSRVLQLLYQAYILPVLDYCDTVWLPSNSSRATPSQTLVSGHPPAW